MGLVSTDMEKAEGEAEFRIWGQKYSQNQKSVGNWRDHMDGGINIVGVWETGV